MTEEDEAFNEIERRSIAKKDAVKAQLDKPQRTWVGLTNDELTDLFYNTNLGQACAVAQAIALLKEKNT